MTMARIVRGQILSMKEQEYITAARTLGASNIRILVEASYSKLYWTNNSHNHAAYS